MLFHQLKVVVWKNLIIRKRHWFLTLIEALLPVFLFFLIAYGRSKISGLNKIEVGTTYTESQPIPSAIHVESAYLLFTPYSEKFNKIIDIANENVLQIPGDHVQGFASEDDLLEFYYKNQNYTTFAIIFDDTNAKKFSYKLRLKQGYNSDYLSTDKRYVSSVSFVPGQGSEYRNEDFFIIQYALDIAFIRNSLKSKNLNDEILKNFTIETQEFPHPPHTRDSSLTELFLEFLPIITLFSFIFICPAVLKRVVEEKHSGTKELLKMVGMKSWMLWLGWFIYGMIPMIFAVIFIIIFMKVPMFGSNYSLIEHAHGEILFVYLILYCTSAIAFCFAISTFFSKPTSALIVGLLIWILSYVIPKYSLGLDKVTLPWSQSIFLNLLPNMALHFGYSVIAVYEERGTGINWNNFYKSGSGGTDDITMLNIYVMLILNTIIYILFTLYMDGIYPGKYGVRKPYLFPIKNLIKYIRNLHNDGIRIDCESTPLENIDDGRHLEKGIEIDQLCKRYGTKMAVHNLKLDIYKNQITVLLGHNGAGKSTTMSVITGMIEATSGSVRINGLSVRNDMDEIRKDLGLCPQHNLLFTDLTVKEHLLFFAKLKGKKSNTEKEVEELLKDLNLYEKRNSMADTLSGGMKRKLCLGMALVGGSKVLILDEPSSGMDPESRRQLWDLLLQWRDSKTILITTHFMEEADALGDWIAIMDNGSLKCFGTPIDLKKQYHTGYHLSIMIDGEDRKKVVADIKKVINLYIKDVEQKTISGKNVVFVIPLDKNKELTKILEVLEEKRNIWEEKKKIINCIDDSEDLLKISNISVTITTLEDVFLKINFLRTRPSEGSSITSESDIQNNEMKALLELNKKSDVTYYQTLTTLLVKKYHFIKRKWLSYAVPWIIAAIFFGLCGFLSRNNDYYTENGPELKLRLNSYRQTSVYYSGQKDNSMISEMLINYQKQIIAEKSLPFKVDDVIEGILKKSKENIAYYKEHMIAGAKFSHNNNEIQLIALYNAIAIHSLPISLNLITNNLAKMLLGQDYSISCSNWPLPSIETSVTPQEISENKIAILWVIMIPIGCLFVQGSLIMFPFTEISTKFIKVQFMCGVPPLGYWLVNLVTDLLFYMLLVFPLIVFLFVISPMLRSADVFGYILLIFFMYGLSGIPFLYLFARKKSASSGFAAFVILGIFLGIILTLIIEVLLDSQSDYYTPIGQFLKGISFIFVPQVGFADELFTFSRRVVQIYNREISPKKPSILCATHDPCCIENSKECKDFKGYSGVFNYQGLMVIGCIFYILIGTAFDEYWVKKVISRFINLLKSRGRKGGNQEKFEIKENEENNSDGLNAKELVKAYSGNEILHGITINLKESECLGILGVNGAGKTTTFRMLTRDEIFDKGSIKISDIDISDDKYMKELSYCPQEDSLNYVLTGREILQTVSHLRGVQDPDTVVKHFLELFDLEKYADIPCGHYSGGNKRKLSLAVSLIGFCKFVLLDEPTNGIDPASRRKCWELIKFMQENHNLSFILTSHSMAECEALCNDLKIMKAGTFQREGTISDLKNEIGGFTLKLKLCNKKFDEVDGTSFSISPSEDRFNNIEEIKTYFTKNGGTIKDQHAGLLHIYIEEKQKTWSKIFKDVEAIKEKNKHLIEDYIISEASLEEVFLDVARENEKSIETV